MKKIIPFGRAICYSGYRENQSPIERIYPSYEEVLEDLTLLSKHFDYIRMYDPYVHAQTVLKVLKDTKLPLKVVLGVEPRGEISNPNCPWGGLKTDEEIKVNKVKNYEQLDLLADLCNTYGDIVLAASVGNECTSDWHGNLMAPETLANHVLYLKKKINQPVTFCEGAHYFKLYGEPIAKVVDFISIHSYPLWIKVPIKKAFHATVQVYKDITSQFPDKQVIFTEYGWATKANQKMNAAEATEENQKFYLDKVVAWSEKNQVPMFLFEAFDEPWKGSKEPDEPEKHWGIMTVKRTPKLYAKKYFTKKD
ncbi:MAG: glycosyl hydrolase [Tenericutes bacterium HGW-Tenericutes-6]|nr:MAG: glycosyl hydrolase [Tenericutes bacterium HGW-Tenericutes-6]